MALTIESVSLMKRYFTGVMERANHHANQVDEVILALMGCIIWRAAEVEVRTYRDRTANMLWMTTDKGDTYSFIYNHNTGNIECHEGNMNGTLLKEFNNVNSLSDLKSFFTSL